MVFATGEAFPSFTVGDGGGGASPCTLIRDADVCNRTAANTVNNYGLNGRLLYEDGEISSSHERRGMQCFGCNVSRGCDVNTFVSIGTRRFLCYADGWRETVTQTAAASPAQIQQPVVVQPVVQTTQSQNRVCGSWASEPSRAVIVEIERHANAGIKRYENRPITVGTLRWGPAYLAGYISMRELNALYYHNQNYTCTSNESGFSTRITPGQAGDRIEGSQGSGRDEEGPPAGTVAIGVNRGFTVGMCVFVDAENRFVRLTQENLQRFNSMPRGVYEAAGHNCPGGAGDLTTLRTEGNPDEVTRLHGQIQRLGDPSGWRTQDGNFNWLRLGLNVAGGAVVGTAAGVLTNTAIRNRQLREGHENIQCTFGAGGLATFGETFIVR